MVAVEATTAANFGIINLDKAVVVWTVETLWAAAMVIAMALLFTVEIGLGGDLGNGELVS